MKLFMLERNEALLKGFVRFFDLSDSIETDFNETAFKVVGISKFGINKSFLANRNLGMYNNPKHLHHLL